MLLCSVLSVHSLTTTDINPDRTASGTDRLRFVNKENLNAGNAIGEVLWSSFTAEFLSQTSPVVDLQFTWIVISVTLEICHVNEDYSIRKFR